MCLSCWIVRSERQSRALRAPVPGGDAPPRPRILRALRELIARPGLAEQNFSIAFTKKIVEGPLHLVEGDLVRQSYAGVYQGFDSKRGAPLRSLDQLKLEAVELKHKLAADNEVQKAYRKEQNKVLENHYGEVSKKIVEIIPEAVKEAEARGLKRAIVGRIDDDRKRDKMTNAEQILQTDFIPPLIRENLPNGIRLRIDSAAILQGSEHDKEGCMQACLLMDDGMPIVDVYVPKAVPVTAQVKRKTAWDGLVFMIEWT